MHQRRFKHTVMLPVRKFPHRLVLPVLRFVPPILCERSKQHLRLIVNISGGLAKLSWNQAVRLAGLSGINGSKVFRMAKDVCECWNFDSVSVKKSAVALNQNNLPGGLRPEPRD